MNYKRISEYFIKKNIYTLLVHNILFYAERAVTFRAAEPAGLLEIRLREPAARAFQFHAAGGLFRLLQRAQAQHQIQIRQPETGRVVDAFGFGAVLAQIQLLHLVVHNLGQMHKHRLFFANGAQHKFIKRESLHRNSRRW